MLKVERTYVTELTLYRHDNMAFNMHGRCVPYNVPFRLQQVYTKSITTRDNVFYWIT